jgi:hypothetical protein
MILVDVNLLLYAHNTSAAQHAEARKWLEETIVKPEPFGLSWITILAFLRISTNPRAFPNPFSIEEAMEIINDLLDQPSTALLEPGANYWAILSDLLTATQSHGPLVMDAHLAALAIENNAVLYTADADFTRFSGLQFVNPLDSGN